MDEKSHLEDVFISAEETRVAEGAPIELAHEALRREHSYAFAGLIFGGLMALAGLILIVLGIAGSVELEITGGDFSAKLQTAVVGLAAIVVGSAVIWGTRFRFTLGSA